MKVLALGIAFALLLTAVDLVRRRMLRNEERRQDEKFKRIANQRGSG